ncbi:hypothetical protein GNE10_13770 [Nostoc sp. 2RC]|nr:hypothetical protein [Nostoc sp. 2RC]
MPLPHALCPSPVLGYISLWTCRRGTLGARHEILGKKRVKEAPRWEFSLFQVGDDIASGMQLS